MRAFNFLAGAGCATAFIAMAFALWDKNISLAVANFNTVLWTVLYLRKES